MLGDELPCFARGTGILTPHGYRRVEELRPGDPVITAAGERRPVLWIGWRTLDFGPRQTKEGRSSSCPAPSAQASLSKHCGFRRRTASMRRAG